MIDHEELIEFAEEFRRLQEANREMREEIRCMRHDAASAPALRLIIRALAETMPSFAEAVRIIRLIAGAECPDHPGNVGCVCAERMDAVDWLRKAEERIPG